MPIHNIKFLKPLRRKLRGALTRRKRNYGSICSAANSKAASFGDNTVSVLTSWIFYCPSEKLVIELDGAAHDSQHACHRDAHRTQFISNQGLRVLRFENRAVMENLEGVLLEIARNFKV